MNIGKIVATAILVGALGGCDHLVEAMQKSVEANAEAVRTCTKHELTIEAQQRIYNRSVGDFIAITLKFPLGASITATSKPIPALILKIERDFAAAYEAADRNGRQNLTKLRDDIRNIKATGEKIHDRIRSEADKLQLGFVDIYKFGPMILNAVALIQGDVQSLHLDIQKLRDDLAAASATPSAAIKILTDEVRDAVTIVEAIVKAFEDARLRKDISQLLPGETEREEIRKALEIVIRFKAAKLAVNRLERELFIIEGKLQQIDQKAWFVISIAELLFESAVRGDIADAKPDNDSKLRQAVNQVTAARTYGIASDEIWRLPIATAACERVLRIAEANNTTTARTDQLLNPIYLRLIRDFESWDAKRRTEFERIRPMARPRPGEKPAPHRRAESPFDDLARTLNAPFQ